MFLLKQKAMGKLWAKGQALYFVSTNINDYYIITEKIGFYQCFLESVCYIFAGLSSDINCMVDDIFQLLCTKNIYLKSTV